MFAALNVYKPLGMTSHDVVSRLRRVFGLKRIGHMGTLDPLAEGVLPVCLGQATRLIEYFPTEKRYTADVVLGRTTTTLDREGEVLSEMDCTALGLTASVPPSGQASGHPGGTLVERLAETLPALRGVITQQVPLYSAVHVGGKKLYELARKGQTAELPSREVTIYHLELLDIDATDPAHPVLKLDVQCSSGTYIRSLARDIGEALGCGASLSGLVRTEHGRFAITESIPLETLQTCENPQQALLDPVPYLAIPALGLNADEAIRRLGNGMAIPYEAIVPAGTLNSGAFYLVIGQDRPLAVVEACGGFLKPQKVFPPA